MYNIIYISYINIMYVPNISKAQNNAEWTCWEKNCDLRSMVETALMNSDK